jgi:paraquat-inducible protein B
VRCISISTSIRKHRDYRYPEFGGYPIIPTVSGGLAQIQQRLMDALDKINNLPLNPLMEQATNSLAQSQKTMQHANHAG